MGDDDDDDEDDEEKSGDEKSDDKTATVIGSDDDNSARNDDNEDDTDGKDEQMQDEEEMSDEIEITEMLINRHFPKLNGVTRRKYYRRYDLKVTVPRATDANVKLLEQFRSFFKKVKESDTKAFLAPYKSENTNEKKPSATDLMPFQRPFQECASYLKALDPWSKGAPCTSES